MKLKASTRGSRLALIQVEIVAAELRRHYPSISVETRIVETTGDLDRERPIVELDQKGVFTRAVDDLVLSGETDFSVHSMKDLPMELPQGLIIAAVPERASPYEAPVHLKVEELSNYFAEAGLIRLDRGDTIKERLSLEDFTPPAGQGALAIVVREGDPETIKALRAITHRPSLAEVNAERSFMETMGGGCSTPIGVVARLDGEMRLYASVLSPDGKLRFQFNK